MVFRGWDGKLYPVNFGDDFKPGKKDPGTLNNQDSMESKKVVFFRGSDEMYARWWFQIFLIFTLKWEDSQFD